MSVAPFTDRQLFERAMGYLDAERKSRVERIKPSAGKSLSLGAGLLLQYAVREWLAEEPLETEPALPPQMLCMAVSAEDILQKADCAGSPLELTYRYGAHGKPYLANFPDLFFSLSHSGDYVLCAVADREIGADIQQERKEQGERIVQKYFTDGEREWYLAASGDAVRKSRFYRLWAGKEAYMS